MKTKWWRWWIVPLIFTILIAVVPLLALAIIYWVQLSQFPVSVTVLGLVFITPFGKRWVVVWPFSLTLAWPAALIIHGVWKRRKARKLGVFPQEALQDRHGGI
jgi:hypothetical protein